MPLLDGLLQVHLELEGWLGYGVGQVVRHVNLQTQGEHLQPSVRLSVVSTTQEDRIKYQKVNLGELKVLSKASGGAWIQLSKGIN